MFKYIEEYVDFSIRINDYISTVMVDNGIGCEEYNYSHIWELVKSQGVAIRGFSFEGGVNERISGMLLQDKWETTIAFNQQLDEKNKNFVISHEIIHYLFHDNEKNGVFLDTQKSLQYYEPKLLMEFQANIGASIILIPDTTLICLLKKGWNIVQLSDFFGIPENTLTVRLVQMMQADLGMTFKVAKGHVDDICYEFNNKGKFIVTMLATELENHLKQKKTVHLELF
ncbi:ImmA/IrrE family metallo-endopeptidase [Enterococcus quebecensis]|uniref:IrrE N-terminal-like domain-containing protein n=1 Tax=Enterococcus quebecensis TaxID=903983 RepID=A0A1E5GTJ9_9ENTE|nr:ImmA/IrrE family metallo-endopeptidase [Enterococcus quebecensis]OEG15996.1 hypothetical protein BCR23_07565 [Enterococcus quebecensis]OJG74972.1 hypothetical protein RV12_GL002017 [Enterococcus quebecensis]